jgi:dynein heavy chain, axonemal
VAETAHDVPKYYCKNYKDRPEQLQDMPEDQFKKNCCFEDDGKGGRVMYVTEESSPIQLAYDKVGEFQLETMVMEAESERLRNLEGLFDLTESKFKQIDECKSDLVNLKKNWDLISLIDSQFDAWKKTLWDQIDTDSLTQACRDMGSKQTNPQTNKEIKGYKSFQALNDRIKNMSKLLPLIGQLHSKYMQDRHWSRLMTTTVKKIDHKNPKFCLNDLLVLELHKFEADVEELVESAAKEDKIDNNIRKIIKEWDKMKFTFEETAGVPVLGETGEIVELVEQHGMDIQGMLGQKDVAEFREVVSKWRGYMTSLELVIEKWRKVQGDWRILRPIFIDSEDIKAQLPDAAATF